MVKINKDELPELIGAQDAELYELRASDNDRHGRIFKMLVRDGVALHGSLSTRDRLPSFELVAYRQGTVKPFIWLTPKVEAFLLTYLMTGKSTGVPSLPVNGQLPDFMPENYVLQHIRREILNNAAVFTVAEGDGIRGIRIKANYPYGSIDYGFFPHSTDEILAQLSGVAPRKSPVALCCDIPELHNHTLPIVYKELAAGKSLDAVFPDKRIPSNTILDKTICGVGATYLEIHAKRDSIIVEPNVPVITGKMQEHKHLIGVFGDKITVREIAQQIKNKTEPWVKIMTTPDSFPKVVKALQALKIPYKESWFLLFDECEKFVSDMDFRKSMILPIDDFFAFKNKAMVSATPIVINDPRFEKQGFQIIKIKPMFDYRKTLELKPTNNVALMVKRTLEKLDKTTPVCLFYNSIKGIEDLIAQLKIVDHANIYCSTEAMRSLKKAKYHVFDSVTDKNGMPDLNHYNFFTSRFYSALDIKLNIQPVVILVSDVHKSRANETPYTLIDPETEAIQIVGRFRNGVSRIIHIANTNWNMNYQLKEELEKFLSEEHLGYQALVALKRSAVSEGEKHIIVQAIAKTDYKAQGFVTDKGVKNYFRYNNAYWDERLKMLYRSPAQLNKAYNRSEAFTVLAESEYMAYTDEERKILNDRNKPKATRIKLLYDIYQRDSYKDVLFINELKREYPLYFDAFYTIGLSKVKELAFVDSAIQTEVDKVIFHRRATEPRVIDAVYLQFQPNMIYSTVDVNQCLKVIYDNCQIKYDKRGLGKNIALYFDALETRTGKQRKWKLGNKKY